MKWVYLAIALLACHLSPQVALAAHNRSEVPFKLYRGYAIVVRGSIGNTHNLNLLIDTGAVPSVLDSRIARKLHLQTTRGTLSVFTQQVEVERATIANVQIGLLHANVLSIAVHDLSNAEQVLGIRVDGMIGLDFLGQTAFTIDYGSKKITVGPVDPSLTAVPYQSGPGYIVVEMQIRHRIIPLLVDTGASELVLFQTAEKDWLDANTIVGRRTWSNMSGDVELQKVHLSDVFLGPTHWGSRDALILERANAVPSAAFRGLLGIISLKARRVGFDPDRKVLAWGDTDPLLAAKHSPADARAGAGRETERVLGEHGVAFDLERRKFHWEQPAVAPFTIAIYDDVRLSPTSKGALLFSEKQGRFTRERLALADVGWPQPTTAAPDPEASAAQSLAHLPVKLPIHLHWDYLVVVEGSIGNMQKLNFLVDTGAYPSAVDQKIARHLGLAEQPATVNLSTKTVQSRLVVLPSITLGPVHAESLPVLAEDLSFLKTAVGQKVDGVVGLDFLRKCNFTINYRTKEMIFGAIDTLTFSASFDTALPLVTIRTRFQNRQLRLVVDSAGADLTLFQSRVHDTSAFQALDAGVATDARGPFHRRKVRVPEVYLGTETIGEQIAFVVDDRRDHGVNFDGVLGVRGPQFRKIAFDFEHGRFSWER